MDSRFPVWAERLSDRMDSNGECMNRKEYVHVTELSRYTYRCYLYMCKDWGIKK